MALRPRKQLQICPQCAGYMRPKSAIQGQRVQGRHWQDETRHRSFGGQEVRQFICEKCQHVATFQIDDLVGIGEDD